MRSMVEGSSRQLPLPPLRAWRHCGNAENKAMMIQIPDVLDAARLARVRALTSAVGGSSKAPWSANGISLR